MKASDEVGQAAGERPARRGALVAGVAVAALAAGAGIASWRLRTRSSGSAADDEVWQLDFERPGGGRLALSEFRGRPLLLNFWATWCPPCVKEMPLIDRFQREHAADGWQVAGIAVDNAGPVNDFLAKHPVGYAIGLAGAAGAGLSRRLGNELGALPFSIVFDRHAQVVERKLGVLSEADFKSWLRPA